jgi:thiosulfate/3-mercaptopyruvate sulfurtransferase
MDSRIVLYYEGQDLIPRTARVFLTLDYAGLGERTFVLNGGLPGWLEEERKTTNRETAVTKGDLKPGVPREVIIGASELNQHRWDPEFVIVDVRSKEEYYGKLDSTGHKPTGGHVEGAYFMPYEEVFSESKPYMWREETELLKEFERTGMDSKKTAVYYCGSGIRAAVSYLTARHLGYQTLLYDGSYQEWKKLGLPLTSPVIDPF